jgi:hypothetical protein
MNPQEAEVEEAPKQVDDEEAPSLLEDPRKLVITGLIVLLMFGGIYVLLPKLIGLEDAIQKME